MKNIKKQKDYYKYMLYSLKEPVFEQIYAINSFLKLSGKKLETDEKELLELAVKSCRNLLNLIDCVGLYLFIENKNFKLKYEKFDFVELVKKAVSDIKIISKIQKINIIYNYKNNIIVNGDKNKLKLALEGICDNIFDYIYKESELIIEIKIINNRLFFELKGRGKPLSQEEFQNFYNICEDNNLKIYLMREIIKKHFGSMILKSEQGINTLGFQLPIS